MRISSNLRFVLDHPWQFSLRVSKGFLANQGFLLAGAVAYYTLLTIVPMFALIMTALSQFQETQGLLQALREYLVLISPNQADALIQQITIFQDNWKLVGITGIVILLFFSSLAFTSLESAMSVIFFHRVAIKRRHFLVSAIIPYSYILVFALGMLLVNTVSVGLHNLEAKTFALLGYQWSLSGLESILLYLLGFFGEILLLTSLYLVMPVGILSLRHALIGGLTATILWEITRHILVWYFTNLSLVNIVYGTFATAIIILLTLEAAAIIILLGAQVIAEYERIGKESGTPHGLQT
ncbi:MAG: YihY/virulence factor BrkB family protein [Gammaproteobacteria bacterium]|nr:YihY/virulence factor BrkB family protein [Gammaproteobacteria bacterium]